MAAGSGAKKEANWFHAAEALEDVSRKDAKESRKDAKNTNAKIFIIFLLCVFA
jgi:hypothetical protein